jgi:hypothetical protein
MHRSDALEPFWGGGSGGSSSEAGGEADRLAQQVSSATRIPDGRTSPLAPLAPLAKL